MKDCMIERMMTALPDSNTKESERRHAATFSEGWGQSRPARIQPASCEATVAHRTRNKPPSCVRSANDAVTAINTNYAIESTK
eukprot:NODE_10732_length_1333_cov_2.314262.p2 GENE.NODE_10732_length_1333_cov_2.314262~~NODE_10732_length_1333_cov_2.314262.p2  ORF type:complete len:83 (-),score=4.31 NODE_10732_length_1333_cov_2.314262:694-942(-)